MGLFFVYFTQFHLDFRLQELDALAKLEGIDLKYADGAYSNDSPFMVVELPSNDDATKLISRAILVNQIYELWGEAPTLEELNTIVKQNPEYKDLYKTSSFKFIVGGYGVTLSAADQLKRIEQFSYLGWEGKIDLKKPDNTFGYFEDYGNHAEKGLPAPEKPHRVYLGRQIASGNRRIVNKYDLKKREYLGITSMDAELSLIMANQALVRPGSFVLDPFVGTGSFLITCAHFGAFTMGSDIDGRQIRGKDGKGIVSNGIQYNLTGRIVDNIVSDLGKPPYGVRAGAKKIGTNDKLKPYLNTIKPNGDPRYPQTIPYEMHDVLLDLIDFAAIYLVPGGRLVYWFPTVTEEYSPDDVPLHPYFKMIANSEQNFGKWARRLITMEKLSKEELERVTGKGGAEAGVAEPAHARFRSKYFEKHP
ncbi:hypothetical protein HK097_010014 [Rhizophlyctis rosea]|uniref:Uncharacterized protein n=1 Tax=Rhizophlyctis rosea TaxID=64517 RepID=A0AAD5SKH9_9FUNG|nr:hypothetical protein HK097_010014 [Rhizophlyctis rosea]